MENHSTHYGTLHSNFHIHHQERSQASLVVQRGSIRPAGQASNLRMMIHNAHGGMVTEFEVHHEEKAKALHEKEFSDVSDAKYRTKPSRIRN